MPIQSVSQALGNESGGSPFGFKNRIINGAMAIDQRNDGASVSISSASNTYFIDRWRANAGGSGGAFSVQRSTVAPAGFTNSILATVTTADSSVGAGDFYHIRQSIEGFNFSDMGFGTVNAQTVSVSFWVRSSVVGNYSVLLRNEAGDRGYLSSYTINQANTWEYKTVIIPGDTSGTWPTDNSSCAILSFSVGTGATQSLNTWGSSINEGFSGQTQWISTNGATFYITGVQLEKGIRPTNFDWRPFNVELQMCQRYYQQLRTYSGIVANGAEMFCIITLQTQMRTGPSFTLTEATGGGGWTGDLNTFHNDGKQFAQWYPKSGSGFFSRYVKFTAEL